MVPIAYSVTLSNYLGLKFYELRILQKSFLCKMYN